LLNNFKKTKTKLTAFFADMPRLSKETRTKAIQLLKTGLPLRKVANILNCSFKAIHKIKIKFNDTGSIRDMSKPGRPRKTSVYDDRKLKLKALKNRFLSAPQVRAECNYQSYISVRTTQRRLREFGLFSRIAARKPMITSKNRLARKAWAKAHETWGINEWKKVAFSDECKFSRIESNLKVLVRRKKGEKFAPYATKGTLQGGGDSITAWGIITCKGVGPLVFLDGNLNGKKYINVLKDHFYPYYYTSMRVDTIFQQDNAPSHRSNEVKQFIDKEMPRTLHWPAQSPDANIIENVWHRVKHELRKRNCTNLNDLKWNVAEIWKNTPVPFLEKLYQSMPSRMRAIRTSKGYPTKY